MMIKISTIIVLTMFSMAVHALTFSQAKKQLKTIYHSEPESFYCGCDIKWISAKKLVPDWKSCGYSPRKRAKRASRIEWEHIVPAWEFGHQRQCWQKGKRKLCSKSDPVFRQMEGDLHNLVPAIGEVNGDRSNFRYNIIPGERRVYGQCDAEVDFKQRVFEPTPSRRGDIARAYFYFEKQYGLKISHKQRQLFAIWDKQDPVSQAECMLHNKKASIQGNTNPFTEKQCLNGSRK